MGGEGRDAKPEGRARGPRSDHHGLSTRTAKGHSPRLAAAWDGWLKENAAQSKRRARPAPGAENGLANHGRTATKRRGPDSSRSKSWTESDPEHPEDDAYGCSRQGLTRFAVPRCPRSFFISRSRVPNTCRRGSRERSRIGPIRDPPLIGATRTQRPSPAKGPGAPSLACMAEREGFEPSRHFRTHTRSRRAHSTALTPLQFVCHGPRRAALGVEPGCLLHGPS